MIIILFFSFPAIATYIFDNPTSSAETRILSWLFDLLNLDLVDLCKKLVE